MKDLFDLVRQNWRYLRSLSVRAYLFTLGITLAVAQLQHDHVDVLGNAALAFVVNPVFVASVILGVLLGRYAQQIRRLSRKYSLKRVKRAYRTLTYISRTQNGYGRLALSGAVPSGHLLWKVSLSLEQPRSEINAEDNLGDGQRRLDRTYHTGVFNLISELGANANHAGPEREALAVALATTFETRARSPRLGEGILVTYGDGPGILSTLNGALRMHLATALPDNRRIEFINGYDRLPFPDADFGWLTGRVFQLYFESFMRGDSVGIAELTAWLPTATGLLRQARTDPNALRNAQYSSREWLMQRIKFRI